MCGRFGLSVSGPELAELLEIDIDDLPQIPARFNIAPTDPSPVMRINRAGDKVVELQRWGLVPSWARNRKIGARMINARSETAADKPAFRRAFARRRCLVPSDGFYEWERGPLGKQPWHLGMTDRGVFAMAGLWEFWSDPVTDEPLKTFTVLTTEANGVVGGIHDRMPVILDPPAFDLWLDPTSPAALVAELMRPYPDDLMVRWPVSSRVNNSRHEGPDLRDPVDEVIATA